MLGWMKTGESWQDKADQSIRAEGSKLEETLQDLFVQIPLCSFVVSFGDKDVPFVQVQGGHHSHESFMTCCRGRSFLDMPFLPFLQPQIRNMPRFHILEECVLNLVRSKELNCAAKV